MLLEREASRDSALAAFGGGVVCDLTAFAASIYMRGMELILVPASLLAMVDASVGGKTGADYRGYKNLLGTFYPASRVLISTQLLSTLPDKEFSNGLAELIKHGLLAGGDLYKLICSRKKAVRQRDITLMEDLIASSLRVKIGIAEQDPCEQLGIRQQLNFGHTFAHALETSSGLKLSHGEAVAWGIGKALQAGVSIGITDAEYCREVISLLEYFGYPMDLQVPDTRAYLNAFKHDKKRRGNVVPFILQKGLADTLLYPLEMSVVEELVEKRHR